MKKKELIHERNINVRCFEAEEGRLIVEGVLTDERFFRFRSYTADQYRDPGFIHRMTVSLTLSVPDLEILSVAVEMPVTPREECRDIASSIQQLKGLRITAGFTGQVKKLFGKTRGCLHLNNLIIAMGSAAVQGMWTYFRRVRPDGRLYRPRTDQSLAIDSCWLWRKDGPIAARYREQHGRKGRRKAETGNIVITIDGPAGAGKSTVSRALAGRLSCLYLDTGAIYRAVAFAVLKRGVDPGDGEGLAGLLGDIRIELRQDGDVLHVLLDGEDVTGGIRTEEIGLMASRISAVPAVRVALLDIQRGAAARGRVVAEGRDMGTVVFPQADYKFYLDADTEERASRRYKELQGRAGDADFDRVRKDIIARDRLDSERETAPLRAPDDAIVIDSSNLTADEVVQTIVAYVRGGR